MMMGKTHGHFRLMLAGAAMSALIFASATASAETPADTLVQAWAIDDIISLDPAEAFELSTGEITGNTYDMLVKLDIADTTKVVGGLADSWTVSDDGLTYTFKLKPNLTFASGNPVTAEDVAWSFERAVKLNKTPAFIIQQFGLTADNVTEKAKAVDPTTFQFVVDKAYAPSFVLNCLTATVAAVVDSKLVKEHAAAVTPSEEYKFDNDFGHGWLKTGFAGSGPFKTREWRANEAVVLERNDNYYGEKPVLARVVYRHVKESATQRLMLEKGDVDIARNLQPGDFQAVGQNADLATTATPKSTIFYFSLNQKNENLAKPEVREAFKYLVDYDTLGDTLLAGIGVVHQNFLPKGILGALEDKPYKLDVAKAKELLAKAGLPDGFSVTMDTRSGQPEQGIAEAIQQTAAEAGIKIELVPEDFKQLLTRYRARQHDIAILQWGVDYWDPNSNAETFAVNPDNADDSQLKTLAWRNAWDVPAEMQEQAKAALLERDAAKRAEMYGELQKKVREQGPFTMLWQQTEVAGLRKNVQGFKLGPTFDTNFLAPVSK